MKKKKKQERLLNVLRTIIGFKNMLRKSLVISDEQ